MGEDIINLEEYDSCASYTSMTYGHVLVIPKGWWPTLIKITSNGNPPAPPPPHTHTPASHHCVSRQQ